MLQSMGVSPNMQSSVVTSSTQHDFEGFWTMLQSDVPPPALPLEPAEPPSQGSMQ